MVTQLSFTEDNVKKSPFDYPKLKLAKGETAILTVVEDPYSEYVHRIEKPLLDDAGNVLMQTKDRLNGTQYTVPRTSWVSSPICLGDREVLDAEGLDPENCIVCARAAAGEKGYKPKRRFAMHVIRTNTRPNSFDPVEPWGGQLVIWAFTDTIFNDLFSFNKKFGLDKTDLELGPCTDEVMQKAKLQVANGTVVSAEARAAIFDPKNRAEDPTIFCGNRKSEALLQADLQQVDDQWAKAKGGPQGSNVNSAAALNEGIGNLLDEGESKPAADEEPSWAASPAEEKPEPEAVGSFDDLPATEGSAPQSGTPANDSTKSLASILDDL